MTVLDFISCQHACNDDSCVLYSACSHCPQHPTSMKAVNLQYLAGPFLRLFIHHRKHSMANRAVSHHIFDSKAHPAALQDTAVKTWTMAACASCLLTRALSLCLNWHSMCILPVTQEDLLPALVGCCLLVSAVS